MINKEAQITALADFISEVENLNNQTHMAEDRAIYAMYLSKVAIVLSKVINDEPVGNEISSMERLFGNTWLKDERAYQKAYSTWDRFKGLLVQSIEGMTVNERLFNLGLMDDFDKAVKKKDKAMLRAILYKCFLDENNIEAIIKNELNGK